MALCSAAPSNVQTQTQKSDAEAGDSAQSFIEHTLYGIIDDVMKCRSILRADEEPPCEASNDAQALLAHAAGDRAAERRADIAAATGSAPRGCAEAVTALLGGELFAWEDGDAVFVVDGPAPPASRPPRSLHAPAHSPSPPQHDTAPHGSWAALAGLPGPGAVSAATFGRGFRFDVGVVTAPLRAMRH